ncbi:hypothetical protein TVAG_152870 [Trichomonas vaginalis G3]|uniref:Uncharacterized protein n=1 Tax=Trichomonas vaginalis (strain ATCC PRA-98 / G3) TaxID=412133 RepID=A2G2Z7_TRIV3|nr:hypothetical protein TVAGG3_0582380 [Trichomonas vaginalis G3]EAX88466.1 hypothetical protein TVAG_152870 [Trichomonas vaginalis G3]KAI5522667.1 hypothetical protein TVAGG3_0582380 [Trichomonas vaginalis G3]|eukprot:XP_001301396.1 hypothetical protein [Trichomonas vaginalis G3]
MDFMGTIINSSINFVKRVPAKNIDFLTELKSKSSPKIQTNVMEKLKTCFIDSFRDLIDYSIPYLESTDPDYQEFSSDPKIPLYAAVSKIVKSTQFEWATYPGAIVLIRRITNGHDKKISVNNMQRLMLISLLLADKFIEDSPASNYDFAHALGYSSVLFIF